MKILVADAQEKTRCTVSSRLRSWGHFVTEAEDGQAALAHILRQKDSVDMLITDWDMPRMDGVTLARAVRRATSAPNYIYIILSTDKSGGRDVIRGFREGRVDDYIVKPFSAAQLRLQVEAGGRLIGVERRLREREIELESQAREYIEAAGAIREEIVGRLFSALEHRDRETANHVKRIGHMSAHMARLLGWDKTRIEMITAAAPLHDIGKLGIGDAVLAKVDGLTAEEDAQLKKHTVIGAGILSGSLNPAIQMAERIALSHHEHWDGSGYPNGLRGNRIPLEAQLVAVADEYDVRIAGRGRIKGQPEKKVLADIRNEAGRKFSPDIVDLFSGHINEIKEHCRHLVSLPA